MSATSAIDTIQACLNERFRDCTVSIVRLSLFSATFHIAICSEPFYLERLWKLCDKVRREFDACLYIHLIKENGIETVAIEIIVDEEYRYVDDDGDADCASMGAEQWQPALTESFVEIVYKGSYQLTDRTVLVCEVILDEKGAFNIGRAMDRLYRRRSDISLRLYPRDHDRPHHQTIYAVVNHCESETVFIKKDNILSSNINAARTTNAKRWLFYVAIVYVSLCVFFCFTSISY